MMKRLENQLQIPEGFGRGRIKSLFLVCRTYLRKIGYITLADLALHVADRYGKREAPTFNTEVPKIEVTQSAV